jgi:hypothetical protein
MSNSSDIDRLLEEVRALKARTEPADLQGELAAAREERDRAISHREQAERARDAAVAELANVKASVAWTMQKLRIKDLLFMRGEPVPAAHEGWLPGWGNDPEDTARIAWINQHGRVSYHDQSWSISIPHHIVAEQSFVPEVYNFRHIVDLCRLPAEEYKERYHES